MAENNGGRPLPGSYDLRLLRIAGLVLPAAVWVLVLFSPPREGLTLEYVAVLTGLLAGLALVDQTAPGRGSSPWRRLLWLAARSASSLA